MAIMRMNENFDLDKFDPYKDTLVTTVRGTAEEVQEVLDKLMGDETNKIKRNTVSLRQKWISPKDRMPEYGRLVLVVCKVSSSDHTFYAQAIGCCHGPRLTDDADSCDEDWTVRGINVPCRQLRVTHWMPLPPYPEQKEDNDD